MNRPVEATFIRAFISISVEASLIANLQNLQRSIQADIGNESVRWTRADQLHLTLKFFGNVAVEELPRLKDAFQRGCEEIGPFQLGLEKLGCFRSLRRPSVIWVGIQGDLKTVQRLHANVDRETSEFGSHSEERDFHPHLTIGRVKAQGRDARRVGDALLQNGEGAKLGEWTVDQVKLTQSKLCPQGSTYIELTGVSLSQCCKP